MADVVISDSPQNTGKDVGDLISTLFSNPFLTRKQIPRTPENLSEYPLTIHCSTFTHPVIDIALQFLRLWFCLWLWNLVYIQTIQHSKAQNEDSSEPLLKLGIVLLPMLFHILFIDFYCYFCELLCFSVFVCRLFLCLSLSGIKAHSKRSTNVSNTSIRTISFL